MLKELLKKKFDLQIFAEGDNDPAGNPEGGNDPQGDPNSEGANPKGANSQGGPEAPFAVFPDKQSFMARVNREAKKLSSQAQQEFLANLGIDSVETLQTIIADYTTRTKNEKSELQKATERVSKLEKENLELQARIANGLRHSTVKNLASELGVEASRIDRFMKLVDMEVVEIQEGQVSNIDVVKDSLISILDEFPEFKGINPTQSGGGNDFSGDKGEGKKLTMEDVKKMTTTEIQERWAEVEEVLKAQK